MLIEDEIRLFDEAVLIIAQHGAGLGNVVWMQDNTVAVEFGFESRPHFKRLCEAKGIGFYSHPYEESHITVDCNKFINWLRSSELTQQYFGR